MCVFQSVYKCVEIQSAFANATDGKVKTTENRLCRQIAPGDGQKKAMRCLRVLQITQSRSVYLTLSPKLGATFERWFIWVAECFSILAARPISFLSKLLTATASHAKQQLLRDANRKKRVKHLSNRINSTTRGRNTATPESRPEWGKWSKRGKENVCWH